MDKLTRSKLIKIASHPALIISSYIFTVVGFLVSLSDNIVLQIVAISIMAVCFTVLIIALIKYRLNVKEKAKRIEEEYQNEYFDKTKKVMERVSDVVGSVVDNSLIVKNSSVSSGHFRSICENICNLIGSLLCEFCGIEFSVCLKQICVKELLTNQYAEASTQTIARSGSRKAERAKNDFKEQPISENTSFLTILNNNDRCWASHDLNETERIMKKVGDRYKNPDKDYKKYYLSTIVVPIRIAPKFISGTILEYSSVDSSKGFHYIAFLCIDSPQKFTSKDQRFNLASVVLAACGDALYPLFENKLVKEIDKVDNE